MKPSPPKPPTSHLDQLDRLTGMERGQYYRQHAKAIRRETLRLLQHRAGRPAKAKA